MMVGLSAIFDVVFGLMFIFLLLSLVATWVQELLATTMNWRAKFLVKAIAHMLDPSTRMLEGNKRLDQPWSDGVGTGMAGKLKDNALKAFYEHPLIKVLAPPQQLPSYISTPVFGNVIFDLLAKAGAGDSAPVELTLANLTAGIEKLANPLSRESLLALVMQAEAAGPGIEQQLKTLRQHLEAWFDTTMERASGWYKRSIRWWALAVGVTLAVVFNADAITLAYSLYQDPVLRNTISEAAVAYVERGDDVKANEAQTRLMALSLPIGWSSRNQPPATPVGWILRLLGWLLSGFAIAQGAPFWFDLLNRFTNLRGTGKRPEPATGGG
jgi:hypothetical protein